MSDFRMPSLGADMESGTFVEWRVKPGDRVKRGDLIATVETVKGAIDIEVFVDGVVEELLAIPGAVIPVNAVMARLRTDGEAAVPVPNVPKDAAPTLAAVPSPAKATATPSTARASPVARKRAAELGVELSTVRGTGPDGAISLADVEALARTPSGEPATSMRTAIAAAMSKSKREIPHYYLATDIDLGNAMAWLEKQNQQRPVTERLLPAALLLKAVARAIHEVPEMNGTCVEGRYLPSEVVNLGVAVNLRTGGLFAPAIPDAAALSLDALMKKLTELVIRARAANLRSSELGTGTITVSNLGDLGVGVVFPVIQPPQVAMVGFGRITSRPWVVDGKVVVRQVMTASLAADHRVSDGHRGGKFLGAIERLLQEPQSL